MALALKVSSLDGLDDSVKGFYTQQQDGSYQLELDTKVVDKSRLDEFRANNVQLLKDMEKVNEQLTKYKDIDPEKYQQLLKDKQEIEDKKLIEAGEVEKLLEQRTERMRSDYEGQTKALMEANEKLTKDYKSVSNQLSDVLINSKLTEAVTEIGVVRQGAMKDVLSRGRKVYQLVEGQPTPIGGDGNPIYGKDGKKIMTFKEWATGLVQEAPFLFEKTTGGGSKGGGAGTGDKNPTVVDVNDPIAFGNNLEAIAKGETIAR